MLTLAFASYLSLYPFLLFPPLALLCYDRLPRGKGEQSLTSYLFGTVSVLLASLYVLLYMSYHITGSWEFMHSTYGVQLLLPDLTPNVGLWWYFFIELFDSFRGFFLGL